jgi:succinoglycan biosynthesis transport protein ExoP
MNKPTMKKKSSDDAMPELTLRDMLTPIFRHRRMAIAAFSAVFVLAILLAWVWAARYYSSMFQVVVEQDRTDPTVTTAQSGSVSSKPVTTDQVASEVALLQGTDMLRNVVATCGLASEPSFLDSIFPPKDPAKSKAVRVESATRRLEKKLKVEAQKTSDVIDVSYGKMGDPETPACVLQTLSKLYLDKHLQLQRPAGTSDFFADETKKYEKALADSELQLASFANQQGGAPDLVQVNMAQTLAKTELDYQLANELIAAHKKRIANIKEQMAITPSRSTTTEVSNSSNMLLQNLQALLLAAQVKRTDLLVKYEPDYPLVREVDQEIAQTLEAINKAQDLKYVNKTMDRDPTYEFLREDLAKTNADLASATASAAALSNSLKNIKLEMANLDSQAVKQASLLREVKANEANYLLYLNKREQERSSDALDKRGIANVAISVPPTVPLLPAHSPMAVMGIGFVLALMVGIGSALLAEHFDPSFRTPNEIVESLNIPVLASVPRRAA